MFCIYHQEYHCSGLSIGEKVGYKYSVPEQKYAIKTGNEDYIMAGHYKTVFGNNPASLKMIGREAVRKLERRWQKMLQREPLSIFLHSDEGLCRYYRQPPCFNKILHFPGFHPALENVAAVTQYPQYPHFWRVQNFQRPSFASLCFSLPLYSHLPDTTIGRLHS